MFISQEWHKRAEKTSLLTASGVLWYNWNIQSGVKVILHHNIT
jgi:hypothetical protein